MADRRELLFQALHAAAPQGLMTFAQYMELVLYHPEGGYYTRPDMTVGRGGDFFTTPTLHVAFGTLVARQLHQFWEAMGRPATFQVLELGPGSGAWAAQILEELGRIKGAWRELRYTLLEKSPSLRAQQRARLLRHGAAVRWVDTLTELAPPGTWEGVVISNEFFDAMPVHRVMRTGAGLRELGVKLEGDRLRTAGLMPTDPRLEATLAAEQIELKLGQQAEINLLAEDWLRELGGWLDRGWVLTVDYGGLAPEVYDPRRMQGSLRGYYRQLPMDDPFAHPGEQDLTADVDFTMLVRAGEAVGLRFVGLTSQGEFLRALGIEELGARAARTGKGPIERAEIARGFARLHHPTGLGEGFRVLVQQRGLELGASAVRGLGGAELPRARRPWPWERRPS